MATIFVKNTDKSERLFDRIFEQVSGKTLSKFLGDQYGLTDMHLPLENNRFTIIAFTLEDSYIKVSMDESVVDAIWENLNDNIFISSQYENGDFVLGEIPPDRRNRKGVDDVIVLDWAIMAYRTIDGDKQSIRDCTTMVFKDCMPDDVATIRTVEFINKTDKVPIGCK